MFAGSFTNFYRHSNRFPVRDAMNRPDDEDDFFEPPPPKKSGGTSAMLIVGIVLGAVVLVGLLLVVCGGAFFLGPVAPPDEHQHWEAAPAAHDNAVMEKGGPAMKQMPVKARQPERPRTNEGPPAGPPPGGPDR